MSRTYKDKPYKFSHKQYWEQDRVLVSCEVIRTNWLTKELEEYTASRYIELPTTKTKKRKEVDTEDHWRTTPMWWHRLTYTRPERRKVKMLLATVADVETIDVPDTGRLPKIYFW